MNSQRSAPLTTVEDAPLMGCGEIRSPGGVLLLVRAYISTWPGWMLDGCIGLQLDA